MTALDVPALTDAAAGVLPDVVALRRAIHRRPELGLDLPETQQAVLGALGGLPLDVRTGRSLTSVVADLDTGRPGPTVLLRADMDALPMPEDTDLEYRSEVPGAMHACGHDAHTAMLAGAARVLCDLAAHLHGRVRFMFQPGEEGFHGAKAMIDEGVLDGVDAAFAIHVTPNVPSGYVAAKAGPFLASADDFHVVVRGRGGHASTPHLANDPVPVACEIVGALQTMVTRRVHVFEPAVVTVASVHAGTTSNVIPEVAELRGTIRATSPSTRRFVRDQIEQVVQGVAQAHGMEADVGVEDGYPVTANHAAFVERVEAVVGEILGADHYLPMPWPAMGAEDFSYVLERVEGAIVFLGVCPPGADAAHAAGCHSNRMILDEDALAAGVALHAGVAMAVLGSEAAEGMC